MRIINSNLIKENIKSMLIKTNHIIDNDLFQTLSLYKDKEKSTLAKSVLNQILNNAELAKRELIPICQDTGIVVVFLEIGREVHINGNIEEAINEGIKEAYEEGYLRKSVVSHPLNRINTEDNTPGVIHYKIVEGDKLKIKIAPKGAGSENMSSIKMLNPADGEIGIKRFVIDTIINAGGKPCPPIIVGVGIGGTFEKCALLSKEALLRDIKDSSNDPICNKLEKELLEEINNLDIGPMGLGGSTTALAVKVNHYPCHIASLPVSVNIQCHVSRHEEVIL